MKALDIVVRLATFGLSVLATLAIVASLVSVSHQPGGLAGPIAERASVADPVPDVPRELEQPVQARDGEAAGKSDMQPAIQTAPSPDQTSATRWLEALTYALIALAGFAAAILCVLMRISGHLARLAARGGAA